LKLAEKISLDERAVSEIFFKRLELILKNAGKGALVSSRNKS